MLLWKTEKPKEIDKNEASPEILDLSRRIRKIEMRLVNANTRMDRIEQDFDDFITSLDDEQKGDDDPDG